MNLDYPQPQMEKIKNNVGEVWKYYVCRCLRGRTPGNEDE